MSQQNKVEQLWNGIPVSQLQSEDLDGLSSQDVKISVDTIFRKQPPKLDPGFATNNIKLTGDTVSTGGVKHDRGKAMLSLVNRECLNGIAKAMEYGLKKYGKNNYKQGMDWSRVIDAGLRHLNAWAAKIDNDEESNLNHLYHAGACINMLLYYVENNIGKDDR